MQVDYEYIYNLSISLFPGTMHTSGAPPRHYTEKTIFTFHFPLSGMGSDRGYSFPFDFEQNGIPFGSKSKGKLSPKSYPIQFERKWNTSFLSVSK